MSDNYTVLNSCGVIITMKSKDVGGGVEAVQSVPTDISGNPMLVGPSSAVTSSMSAMVVAISSLSANHLVTLSSAPAFAISSAIQISSGTVTLSSNPTVIPSSAVQVTLTSNTVALSSTVTVGTVSSGSFSIISGANTANVVAGSSAVTSTMAALVVAISTLGTGQSISTVTSLSSGTVVISNGANLANVVAGSSSVTSTMAALVVALSTLGSAGLSVSTISSGSFAIINGANTVTVKAGNSGNAAVSDVALVATIRDTTPVQITNGTIGANVLAGSSVVTSTMNSLVVSISSNGAGVITTGTPTAPSSQYISAVVVGDLLTGASNSSASNPVAIGGIYNSTNPTSVTSGQRVQGWFDKSGKMIAVGALRALKGTQLTAISCSTTETNITPTSSAGLLLDIYGLILSNGSTSNTQTVTIKDSSGGTSRGSFTVPANDTRGFMLPVDSAWVQSASSQAWTATLSNSSGAFNVTTLYVTNI